MKLLPGKLIAGLVLICFLTETVLSRPIFAGVVSPVSPKTATLAAVPDFQGITNAVQLEMSPQESRNIPVTAFIFELIASINSPFKLAASLSSFRSIVVFPHLAFHQDSGQDAKEILLLYGAIAVVAVLGFFIYVAISSLLDKIIPERKERNKLIRSLDSELLLPDIYKREKKDVRQLIQRLKQLSKREKVIKGLAKNLKSNDILNSKFRDTFLMALKELDADPATIESIYRNFLKYPPFAFSGTKRFSRNEEVSVVLKLAIEALRQDELVAKMLVDRWLKEDCPYQKMAWEVFMTLNIPREMAYKIYLEKFLLPDAYAGSKRFGISRDEMKQAYKKFIKKHEKNLFPSHLIQLQQKQAKVVLGEIEFEESLDKQSVRERQDTYLLMIETRGLSEFNVSYREVSLPEPMKNALLFTALSSNPYEEVREKAYRILVEKGLTNEAFAYYKKIILFLLFSGRPAFPQIGSIEMEVAEYGLGKKELFERLSESQEVGWRGILQFGSVADILKLEKVVEEELRTTPIEFEGGPYWEVDGQGGGGPTHYPNTPNPDYYRLEDFLRELRTVLQQKRQSQQIVERNLPAFRAA